MATWHVTWQVAVQGHSSWMWKESGVVAWGGGTCWPETCLAEWMYPPIYIWVAAADSVLESKGRLRRTAWSRDLRAAPPLLEPKLFHVTNYDGRG